LQPLTAGAFKDATRAVSLVAAAMKDADFNVALMRERATMHGVSITELADTLAREHGLPFSAGHKIAARMLSGLREGSRSASALLKDASREVAGREIAIEEAALTRLLSPEHFVAVRTTLGGPSPEVTAKALGESRQLLTQDRARVAERGAKLAAAEQKRKAALKAL